MNRYDGTYVPAGWDDWYGIVGSHLSNDLNASDYRASIHDVAPTVLRQMGIKLPQPMNGQDLSLILDGKGPEQERQYITLGYDDYSWAEDDDWALAVRNDGEEARLYDLREDPRLNRNVSGDHPEVVKRMWNEYIIKDASGEPLPMY